MYVEVPASTQMDVIGLDERLDDDVHSVTLGRQETPRSRPVLGPAMCRDRYGTGTEQDHHETLRSSVLPKP